MFLTEPLVLRSGSRMSFFLLENNFRKNMQHVFMLGMNSSHVYLKCDLGWTPETSKDHDSREGQCWLGQSNPAQKNLLQ